jgi:pilus assembly protein Flp/PilA
MIDNVKTVWTLMSAALADRKGVTALEYGVIAAVTIVVGLAAFATIGTDLAAKFASVDGLLK